MDGQSDNVARARAFVQQVQVEGRIDLIDDFVHPDFRNRTAEVGRPADRSGVHLNMVALRDAFADRSIETVHCFESDDVVASNRVVYGRHVGNWLGEPPTGERVALRVMDFVRFHDGRIIEHWSAVRSLEPAGSDVTDRPG